MYASLPTPSHPSVQHADDKQQLLVAAVSCASSPFTQSQRVHTKERRTRHSIANSPGRAGPHPPPAAAPYPEDDDKLSSRPPQPCPGGPPPLAAAGLTAPA